MNKIKHYMIPEHVNELFKNEAISSISLTREMGEKLNEVIDMVNEYKTLRDNKYQEQDGKIDKAIVYLKHNLKNTLMDLFEIMKYNGEIEDLINKILIDGKLFDALDSIKIKTKNIKDYGAKGDGKNDDAIAIRKMIEDVGYAIIPDGEFTLKSPIKLHTWQSIKGNGNASILKIDNTIGEDVFLLTKYNEVSNLVIKQTDTNWTGNYFTISSETLESENLTAFENLSIKIHDLVLNTARGTFIHYWATEKDSNGKQYKTYGLWNLKVYNINHFGKLDYIQRSYVYNHDGKTAWITQNNWDNCVFNSVIYGWYGSKNADTFEISTYHSSHFKIKGCTVQALSWTKNLFYFTGEVYAEIYDVLPYDWQSENPNYKPFRIRNENMVGRIMLSQNRFTYKYMNWIEFTNPVTENLHTYLGDFLFIDGVQYKYIQKPLLIDMGVNVSTNYMVFKIAELDEEFIKRNLHFNLYYKNTYKKVTFSLVVDWEGKCTVYHDPLKLQLADLKFVKHGKNIYMCFKTQSNTCYLEQIVYPQELFRTFLDMHIETIGDKDVSQYTEIPMQEF